MPCLIVILALLIPRVAMALIWLFTDWFSTFATWIWPLLGFFFMPYTTLAYMAAMLNNNSHVSGGWLILVIAAALVDLGHLGLGKRRKTA